MGPVSLPDVPPETGKVEGMGPLQLTPLPLYTGADEQPARRIINRRGTNALMPAFPSCYLSIFINVSVLTGEGSGQSTR